jgi:Cu(I)/Ag(I) efflux system membrane fusion protein
MRAIVAVLALVVSASAAYLAGSLQSQRAPAAAAEKTRRVLYYHDPMHPDYKSDKPGIAPDCNMALEPVYADEGDDRAADAADHGTPAAAGGDAGRGIAVSAAQQRLMGMTVAEVEQSAGEDRLRLFGRVIADETRVYKVNVGVGGFVRDLSDVTTGAQVKTHQWLATFAAPDARLPAQSYLVALDAVEREKKASGAQQQMPALLAAVQQTTDRLLALGMSPQQVEEIGRTHLVAANIRVTAPADGFVLSRSVSVGEKVDVGAELYRIADLRRVWILLDVPAADAARLEPGMEADVRIAGRGAPIAARVSRAILPQFDPATQSSKVRLEADNPGFALRPDMFVDVDVRIARPSGIVVPAGAVVMSGLRSTVFVETVPGVFEPREVETGARSGDRVAIASGLAAGERIAVTATFLLDSETRMKRHDRPHH